MTKILSLIFFIFIGCNKDSDKHLIKLQDNLGTVMIKQPSYFDTTFTWMSSSDYDCSEKINYRIQSKKLEICKETGFISLCDPQEQISLTINHKPKECWKPIKMTKADYLTDLKNILSAQSQKDPESRIIINEIKTIDNRMYSIFGYVASDGKTKKMVAKTYLDNTYLNFVFKNTSDTSTLKLADMYNYLQTIELK